MSANRKVLLLGWDSADWRVIRPLLDANKLPNLKKLVQEGVSGNMATLSPALSPMLWTSIATGKRPHKHGIYGFAEPDPHTGGVRPITNLSRKTKAVWNILSQNGLKCIVVGWWPSHPAEPIPNGVMVSNAYQRAPDTEATHPWRVKSGTVHPTRLATCLGQKRLHPTELNSSYILRFVPKASEIDREKDRRLNALTKIITDCTNIQAASLHLIENEPWDLMVVYYDAIDHFGHGFMRYHPPRQKWISKKDFDLYSGVIEASYSYHDMMLGELLASAGPDTTVLLMSDHGFHPDNSRPSAIPIEPAGPAVEHRQYGIFVLKGSDIKTGGYIQGATVLDICPTLLSLFNFPVGQDMDGKTLVTAWTNPPNIKTIASWDAVPGIDGSHGPDTRLNPDDSREALKQLEALGYIEALPEDAKNAVENVERELQYNLACSYIDADMPEAASHIFEILWANHPEEHRYGARLFSCQHSLAQISKAWKTFERLRINRRKYSNEARQELIKRRKEVDEKPKELTLKEKLDLERLTARAKLSPVPMQQMEAILLLAEGRSEEAMLILEKLRKNSHTNPSLYLHIAHGNFVLKQWHEAERMYNKLLELDSDNAHAYLGLAQIYLATRKNYEAADSVLTSIGLLYHNPPAHYLLGVALHRLGKIDDAVKALGVCLTQNSNFLPAHRRLKEIYRNRFNDSIKAEKHGKKVREGMARIRTERHISFSRKKKGLVRTENVKKAESDLTASSIHFKRSNFDPTLLATPRSDASYVTVVSGLPRSGTSLMMQLLAAGGLPPLHDNCRPADDDNPKGYFEFAPAKNIRVDASWMGHGEGRVLKLVAQLLPFLPAAYKYRIIFMERAMEEILASQSVMLRRHGLKGAALSSEKLKEIYEEQLLRVTEVLEERNLPTLKVSHHEAIKDPKRVARRVAAFLNLQLDCIAMASAIDPSLHRQRLSSP